MVSMYIMCRLVIPYMWSKGGGVILNMSSFTGKRAGGGGSAYVTSKHAICGYTKSLCLNMLLKPEKRRKAEETKKPPFTPERTVAAIRSTITHKKYIIKKSLIPSSSAPPCFLL